MRRKPTTEIDDGEDLLASMDGSAHCSAHVINIRPASVRLSGPSRVDQEGNTLTKRKKNLVSSLCYLHGTIVVEVRSAVVSRWGQRAGDGVVDEGY